MFRFFPKILDLKKEKLRGRVCRGCGHIGMACEHGGWYWHSIVLRLANRYCRWYFPIADLWMHLNSLEVNKSGRRRRENNILKRAASFCEEGPAHHPASSFNFIRKPFKNHVLSNESHETFCRNLSLEALR